MAEVCYQIHLREGEKPICDLCATKSDCQLSKCLECGIYMCYTCTTAHKTLLLTKNHIILSRVEREPSKIPNISRSCSAHPTDDVMYHCFTCKEFICSECIIGIHREHSCTKIATFAKQKRLDLKIVLRNIKQTDIPKIKEEITNVIDKHKENDENKKDNLQKLKDSKLQLMSEIEKNNIAIEIECANIHKKNNDKLRTVDAELNQYLSEMETLLSDYNKTLHTGSDLEVIAAEQEISEKREQINSHELDAEIDLQHFNECNINNKTFKGILGSLQPDGITRAKENYTTMVINHFNCRFEWIQSVCPLPDNMALLSYQYLHEADVVDCAGEIQMTIQLDFSVADSILTSTKDLLLVSGDEPLIYKLTTEGVLSDVMNTAPLLPQSLCESMDGSLLVSLVDETSFTIASYSRRCVSRLSVEGTTLECYGNDNGSGLFTIPYGISENINGDICVVNRTSRSTGHLIIMNRAGKLQCTYNGQSNEEEFCPYYVKCDKLGNIIVNDVDNQLVHMLDSEGQFMRYIATERHLCDAPVSLAVDNTTSLLWIGGHEGRVSIVRYLND